jgi:plasmid maintenance system antidote protein VapI
MAAIRVAATPNRVTTHPGEVLLEEFLMPLGLSVNADTALRLARFFGTSPEFWMNMQAMHDLTKARQENGVTIEHDVQPRAA